MKKQLRINMDKGYTLEEVINDRIDFGAKWAEMGWFENDEFEDGHYYYFSNYYGSAGGFYNEDTDVLIPSWDIEDMDDADFINIYGMDKENVQDNCKFVEYPIDRELSGLHVDYDRRYLSDYFNEKYGEEVIKDDEDLNYRDGRGIYKYIDGLFYEVELVYKD